MAPTTSKFCLPLDVKAYLNQNDGYTGDDAHITTHIKHATALIRNYTRRDWESGSFTEFFDTAQVISQLNLGRAYARFTLKERPLQSITNIRFHTGGEWEDAADLSTDLYSIDGNSVVIYPHEMRYHQRSIRIVYIAGYEIDITDTDLLLVAENIKQACAIQAAFTWRRVLNETQGKSQKQDKQGFANFRVSPSGLIGEAQALLKSETTLLIGRHG